MRFEVYTGAANNVAQDKGLGYRVVMGLMDTYLNTNRQVFMDNYFTSVKLCCDTTFTSVALPVGATKSSQTHLGSCTYGKENPQSGPMRTACL